MAELNGAELIAAERKRQVEVEGWTPEHDDEHADGQLVEAAMCYARSSVRMLFGMAKLALVFPRHNWPWEQHWWKPSEDPIDNLVKAGALIAAEIDRLQRAKIREP